MLEGTFLHVPGIGQRSEQALWRAGVTSWDGFLNAPPDRLLPRPLLDQATLFIHESRARLARRDAFFFARCLPRREHWRAISSFGGEAIFLDIETDGSPDNQITLIGLHDGTRYEAYVRDVNLSHALPRINAAPLLVTFNGSQFDLPVIAAAFPTFAFRGLHCDLRWLCKRAGLTGGLKAIETTCGLKRPEEVQGMDGYDAVRLWQAHRYGSKEALEKLVLYNRCDVENLRPLLETVRDCLRARFPSLAGSAA